MWHKEKKKKHEVEGETSGKEGVKSYVQVFARVPSYTWPTESPQPRAAQLRKKKLSPKDRRRTVPNVIRVKERTRKRRRTRFSGRDESTFYQADTGRLRQEASVKVKKRVRQKQ